MPQQRPELPTPIPVRLLADRCRETAAVERVEPFAIEKDYYLTRLLWAIGQELSDAALLKGGTLLSKVDLGFLRMSEDVDLVLPGTASHHKRSNALQMNRVRDALKRCAKAAGVKLPFPDGERSERDAHARWELPYESSFGPQRILVEASIRPVLHEPRRVMLQQLLPTDDLREASCWALDATEARAEKVRAAFTRSEIRDFFDLGELVAQGEDFTSKAFVALVNRKLAELDAPPLAKQGPRFGKGPADVALLESSIETELVSVLRAGTPRFDLQALLRTFDALWGKASE